MQALDELMERGTARREKMMKNDCLIDKILVRSHEHGHGGRSVGRSDGRTVVGGGKRKADCAESPYSAHGGRLQRPRRRRPILGSARRP